MFRHFGYAAILLVAFTSLSAQAPPPVPTAPSGTLLPVPASTTNGSVPAGSVPTATPPRISPGQDSVTLQYPNSDVQDVLHLYEQLTGKKLVIENTVQGKVNIFIAKPVPREEAVRIIEMSLNLNGYSLVPAEQNLMEVLGVGKNPRSASVPIISDPADLPSGDQVVSFLFKLRYADPTELQQVLAQYFAGPGGTAAILVLPKSGSVIVTQSSSVIRRVAAIIEQVDVPPAEVQSEFIKLYRADAQKVVDMLKEVFDKGAPQPGQPGQASTVPGIRPVRPVAPAPQQQNGADGGGEIGALTALSEDSIVIGKIKLAADVRTNRIHVITRPSNLPLIRKLIAQFDENVEFGKPVTRALRYISAGDVLPVLVQALTEPGTNQQGGAEPAGGTQPANVPGQTQRRTNTATTGGYSAGSSSDTTGGSQNFSEELSTQAVDTAPKAVTVGNAKIIADQRSNSIIVLGNREVVVKVQKILDEMDVSAPQVALSTVIGELTLSNSEEFGVDYFTKFNRGNPLSGIATSRNTGAPLPPTTSGNRGSGGLLDPANLLNFTQVATTAVAGGNVYLAAGNTLSAIVKMLDSTGNFKTISRPTVFTTNNKKAIIASGQEIPIPVNTISSGASNIIGGLSQQSNIQFKKIALQLEVVPLINSEKEVSLDILQKLDSLAGTTRIDNNDIPTIQTRYIKTTVSAPNCSTIVLGGLIQDTKQRGQSGIPVLSRIPVIGGLFRDTTKSKNRTELIVLMRPEVTLTKLDVARLRGKMEGKTHFGPEIDQDDCPDCPPKVESGDKNIVIPAPDLPGGGSN